MILKPVDLKDLQKLSSKELVDMFITSGHDAAEINMDQTGREIDNVYSALLIYLKNHPDVDVRVTQSDGKLYLCKRGGDISEKSE
ncbi:MAG: hypothetical protein WCS74_04290 [Dehalococcoidales bacterium]|jgi:hypothetical protein